MNAQPGHQDGEEENLKMFIEWVVLVPELRLEDSKPQGFTVCLSSNESVRRAQGASLFSRLGKSRKGATCQEHPDSDGGNNLTTGGAGRARAGGTRKRGVEGGKSSLGGGGWGITGNAEPQETPLPSVWKGECSGSGQMRRKGGGQLVCEAWLLWTSKKYFFF